MIHFFITFSSRGENTPFGAALNKLAIPHKIISRHVVLRYHYRTQLYLIGYPKLAFNAAIGAIRSYLSATRPDTVVVNSDIEVWVFSLFRLLLGRWKTRIVLLGFIYTDRSNAFQQTLRRLYFRVLFLLTHKIICFSRLERKRYADIFHNARNKFISIPYGLHVVQINDKTLTADRAPLSSPNHQYAFSAGRSGRDYKSLTAAFSALDMPLKIACDVESAFADCANRSNIEVLNKCYGADYINTLLQATIVIIPLSVDDISAGQMVLLQAMALGKPIIITEGPTVAEYVPNNSIAILVAPHDPDAIKSSVLKLMADPRLRDTLGHNARIHFEANHSISAFVANIVAELDNSQAAAHT